jgi:L-asparaginase
MIEIITTGGTFDKIYHPEKGELCFPDESYCSEILKTARANVYIKHSALMKIDSLEMNDTHRLCILNHIKESSAEKIILIHGTDTMPETARFLRKSLVLDSKAVVLCGAMRPYSLGESDASFNLGFALASVQLLTNGVFIAMNSRVFSDEVQKNKKSGVFE